MKTKMKRVLIISALIIPIVLTSCTQEPKTREFKITGSTLPNTFLLGSHLCRVPMPPEEEMFEDMENLKAHGFNMIKIQTHWAIDEPREGEYNFERYDRLLQHAQDIGLYVYMGFTLEQAPAWLYQKYPECRMVGRNGVPIIYETPFTFPADGKPGPCYDHPVAMEKQLEYIRNYVKYFSHYDNILVWNTWQEIAHWAEWLIGSDICYCEHTQDHFRSWLKSKYGTLENLNQLWGANYGDWQQLEPPRQKPIGLALDKDFKIFMENDYIARILETRYMAIKGADPKQRTVFAHVAYPNIGSGQEWTYARCQDFMGSSTYPSWWTFLDWDDHSITRENPPHKYDALYNEVWENNAMKFDYIRSSNPDNNPVWAAEFQGGPVMSEFQKGRIPSAEDIRRWMLTTIGSGVTAISFWVTRAEIIAQENNGFSLLDSKGTTTERFEEASRIGLALQKHPELFAQPTKPKANVGILINEENYQFCNTFYGTVRHLNYSTRGWYHLLWKNGFAVDFVNMNEINQNTPDQYKALILPFPLCLSDTLAVRLKDYMSLGGNLICEAAAGRINENGFAVRGEMSPLIAEMAGIEQRRFVEVYEPNGEHRWTPDERTWGEYDPVTWLEGMSDFSGMKMLANYYLQTFYLKGGTPIFKAGDEVAGVVNKVGEGKIWLFGTFLGHGGTAYFTKSNLDFVQKLMDESGVTNQKIGDLLVQKRITQNKEAWIITNPTDHDVFESLDLSGKKNPTMLIGDIQDKSNNKLNFKLNSLDIAVLVFEK